MERIRARIKRSRQVNAFAELAHANDILLEHAQEQRPGWYYECMVVILTSAFKLEAFLNHLGARAISYWDDVERLPPKGKLNIIRNHLGLECADHERPFQTVGPLIKYRNAVVHAKSEWLETEDVEVGTLEELRRRKPQTKWEKHTTLEFAERVTKDVSQIIKLLNDAAGFDSSELRVMGHDYSILERRPIDSDNDSSEPMTD